MHGLRAMLWRVTLYHHLKDSPMSYPAGATPEASGPEYGPPGTGPADMPPDYTQAMPPIVPPQYQHPAPPYQPMYIPPPAAMGVSNVTNVNLHARRRVNHALHGTLTLVTCGMWAPVWIFVAVTAPK